MARNGIRALRGAMAMAVVAAAALLMVPSVRAEKIAFKDGRVIDVRSHRVQDNNLVLIIEMSGRRFLAKKDTIDFERSERLNEAARTVPKVVSSAPPKPPTLAEVARRERRRQRRTSSGSNHYSSPYLKQNDPLPVDDPVEQAAPDPGKEPVEPDAQEAPTVVAQEEPAAKPLEAPPVKQPSPNKPAVPVTGTMTPQMRKSGSKAFLLYGAFVVAALGAVVVAVLFLSKRKASPKQAGWAEDLHSTDIDAELLEPEMADPLWEAEPDAQAGMEPEAQEAEGTDDLEEPELVEEFSKPFAEGQPAEPPVDPRPVEPSNGGASPSILKESATDIEIKVGSDTYMCPDFQTLKLWVSEGRIIENSEIRTDTGRWLLAGTLPELEGSFASRRETLGF